MNVKANELVSVNLPMLIKLAKPAAGLKRQFSQIRAMQNGGYLSKLKGRGMEFDEVRPYQAGDDIRSIDWRVTARTGKAHTKLFREERERPVFISVDYRTSMQFATRGVFKSVQAAKIATILAWLAQQQGDKIGGQIFSDNACYELKPQNGKQAVLHFLNALVQPNYLTMNAMGFEKNMNRLAQHVKTGSIIYIISDFRGINKASEQIFARLSRHCQLVLIFVYDALETTLPSQGQYRIMNQTQDLTIDTSHSEKVNRYLQKFQQHHDYLHSLSKKFKIRLLDCASHEDPLSIFK